MQMAYMATEGPNFCTVKETAYIFHFENKDLMCIITLMSDSIYK